MSLASEKVNVRDMNKSFQHFDWSDYTVFLLMLAGSAAIGIYFGFTQRKSKRKSTGTDHESEVAKEYLMGGKRMSVFPVAVSLVASWISGIFLLGTATETYLYGTNYVYVIISLAISGIVIRVIFLPVFHSLQLTSTYEYLEMRFDKRLRKFGSIMFAISTISYLPVVIYVPALAFNQVTGVNIHVVTPFVCVVCIFYTLVGGIRAVVWTDCVQMVLMLLSMIVISIKGTINVSGLETIWDRNWNSGRINFPEFTTDLTERHSILSILLGGIPLYVYTCSMSQSMLQRYVALPTLKDANRALIIFMVLVSALILICAFNGLLIYAYYADCDPLKTKLISAPDQLLPLLMMKILGEIPGMPGLFIAGIFSAALSTLSACLNSMAAVVLEDFYKPFVKKPLTERQTSCVMRGTVLIVGIVSVALVFVVEHLGTVLQLTVTLSSLAAGPLFGLFVLGILCPWVKRKGALTGAIVSLLAMSLMLIYAQHDIATGALRFARKPLSTDGCDYSFSNIVEPTNSTVSVDEGRTSSTFRIHHMSYLFYTLFGGAITIIVASVTSLITKEKNDRDVNPMLFSPLVRKFLMFNEVERRSCVTHTFELKNIVT